MIIFLYGQNSQRINTEADSIVQKYQLKHSGVVNFFNFDMLSGSVHDVVNAIKTASFFDEVKLIVLKNIFLNVQNHENFENLIKDHNLVNDKEIVLLVKEPLSAKELSFKNARLFKLLSDNKNLVRNFEILNGAKLGDWVRREVSLRDCSISPVSVRKLVQTVGKNTARLPFEIDKLSNYRLRGEIICDDIERLVSPEIDSNIFNFLDVLTIRNKARALELLYWEIKTGRDPHYILTMIIYQLRNMFQISDLHQRGYSQQEIIKKTNLRPFVVERIYSQLARLSPVSLAGLYGRLFNIDVGFKSGRFDLIDSLYSFVLSY